MSSQYPAPCLQSLLPARDDLFVRRGRARLLEASAQRIALVESSDNSRTDSEFDGLAEPKVPGHPARRHHANRDVAQGGRAESAPSSKSLNFDMASSSRSGRTVRQARNRAGLGVCNGMVPASTRPPAAPSLAVMIRHRMGMIVAHFCSGVACPSQSASMARPASRCFRRHGDSSDVNIKIDQNGNKHLPLSRSSCVLAPITSAMVPPASQIET